MANQTAEVKRVVNLKVARLSGEKADKALLAKLRRGIGKPPGSIPALWEVVLGGLSEEALSKTGEPTYAEWAVYTALTLYSAHKQGKEGCVSKEGESLGIAVRKLIGNEEEKERVTRRLNVVATSDSMEELAHHLRGLVQLLKVKDLYLDYPALAEDIYWFQHPSRRDGIRLKWGQDFYKNVKEDSSNE